MLPSMTDLFQGQGSVFQHDNDPKHTAKATKQWISEQGFETLTWLPQSPDLSPIENMWRILGIKRHSVQLQPKNENELWQVGQQAWQLITPAECQRIVESMPERIAAVIAAKGGATKY